MGETANSIDGGGAKQSAVKHAYGRPAIGLVATADTIDAIAQALPRGPHHGHHQIELPIQDGSDI